MRRISAWLVIVGTAALVIAVAAGAADGEVVVFGGNTDRPSLSVLVSIPALIALGFGLVGLGRVAGPGLPGRAGLYAGGLGLLLGATNSILVKLLGWYAEGSAFFIGLFGLLALLIAIPALTVTLLRQAGRAQLVGIAFAIGLIGIGLQFILGYSVLADAIQLFVVAGVLGIGWLGLQDGMASQTASPTPSASR